jgi:hypothetical protein
MSLSENQRKAIRNWFRLKNTQSLHRNQTTNNNINKGINWILTQPNGYRKLQTLPNNFFPLMLIAVGNPRSRRIGKEQAKKKHTNTLEAAHALLALQIPRNNSLQAALSVLGRKK